MNRNKIIYMFPYFLNLSQGENNSSYQNGQPQQGYVYSPHNGQVNGGVYVHPVTPVNNHQQGYVYSPHNGQANGRVYVHPVIPVENYNKQQNQQEGTSVLFASNVGENQLHYVQLLNEKQGSNKIIPALFAIQENNKEELYKILYPGNQGRLLSTFFSFILMFILSSYSFFVPLHLIIYDYNLLQKQRGRNSISLDSDINWGKKTLFNPNLPQLNDLGRILGDHFTFSFFLQTINLFFLNDKIFSFSNFVKRNFIHFFSVVMSVFFVDNWEKKNGGLLNLMVDQQNKIAETGNIVTMNTKKFFSTYALAFGLLDLFIANFRWYISWYFKNKKINELYTSLQALGLSQSIKGATILKVNKELAHQKVIEYIINI